MPVNVGAYMLEVKLLGQFEVLRDGRRMIIPTRNAQSLFAYLVLNPAQAHRRERLAGLLWPESSEENARSNLRHELWRLRKALEREGESCFLVDDLTIAFEPQGEYSLDVQMLESAPLETSRPEDLIYALSVYQGELLPGFYEEWVFAERARLAGLYEARMARLLEILQSEGRWTEILDWAMRWVAVGQWPEPAYRALMSAYANIGDLSKAVATYERLSQGLQKDLGVRPSEQTQALFRQLKAGKRIGVEKDPPRQGAQSVKPLPDHAIPSPALPKVRRSNLPRPLTSFIGREKEIRQVERLVTTARLVTITGSGGVGKTRLAIQVASALAPRFKDGVWWVELASLYESASSKKQDPVGSGEPAGVDLVAQALAKTMRIPESPGLTPQEGVVEHLFDKQLLLVLDNCEHLIEACAALAERLLGDCPEVTILATSREALGVPGEKAWLLPSLSLPEKGASLEINSIVRSEAVTLFIERTGDILHGYQPGEPEAQVVAQICLRLGGIPLAIELAAARMNLLAPQEIANRLDSRFSLLSGGQRTALPRHQTLRAAIEWSYDLLGESEQILFRRLSIFAGSFTLEAAEAVCSDEEIRREEVLDLLGRLVNKSLLQVNPGRQDPDLATRYRFLDTICSFGRLKQDEAGETRCMRERHARYYVLLVETAEPELLLPDQARWYKLLQAESDNIRAVIEWSAESGQAESALRLVGALVWFWWSHGSVREGRDLSLRALALPSTSQLREYRGRALNTVGFLQWTLGDIHSARQPLEEALSIQSKLDDEASLAWSLQFLGLALAAEEKYDQADAAMQEGIAIARKLGDLKKSSFSLAFLGDIALQQGDRSKAKRIYQECADLLRSLGNKLFMAYPIRRLGHLTLEQNDAQEALRCFCESLALNRGGGDRRGIAASYTSLATLALHLNKPVLATQLLGVVENQLESLSINLLHLDQIELERIHNQTLAMLDEATFNAAFSQGWEMSEEQAIELVEKIFGDENLRVIR
jgi:predicted ATPase/DNA-binding SARP family transcriptional activator